jgi:UDP-2,3-diacylglucosamine pyrophosphatase LpxH
MTTIKAQCPVTQEATMAVVDVKNGSTDSFQSTYRTVWISDVHLGTSGCNAEELLRFLDYAHTDKLYVVGDFIDVWHLRRKRHWPQAHNDVVQKVLRMARKGVAVAYVPGNHDEFCLHYLGSYGNIEVHENIVHTTADGRRLMVMHGHEFDSVTINAKWLALLGDIGYQILLRLNTPLNMARNICGLGYWSLSAFMKSKIKGAVNYISSFEDAVCRYAELHKVDGIICGHIHTPTIREVGKTLYLNSGDWVESCSALIEHQDGRIELLYWRDIISQMSSAELIEQVPA